MQKYVLFMHFGAVPPFPLSIAAFLQKQKYLYESQHAISNSSGANHPATFSVKDDFDPGYPPSFHARGAGSRDAGAAIERILTKFSL